MNDNGKIQFTSDGLKSLEEELKQLLAKKPDAIDRVARAREFGDLSENSEYHAAREDLSFIEGRIEELEALLKKAEIVKKASSNNEIAIGCLVTLGVNGDEQTYEIVGEWEADPMQKKISHTSPLGKSLLGKKKGEKVEIEAPAGKVVYTVKKIH